MNGSSGRLAPPQRVSVNPWASKGVAAGGSGIIQVCLVNNVGGLR
jgi:hypothetical protein